ncbi:MAG: lipase family protein [Planctomycetes bacterium]|nr:lipase family protein [Planctomycetota bacterium]
MSAFNPAASGFDVTNARHLAAASELAYAPEAEIPDKLKAMGYTRIEPFNMVRAGQLVDTQGFIAGNNQWWVLCFRGTESKLDCLTDVYMRKGSHPLGGTVHEGFKAAFGAAWDKISATLSSVKGQPIWVTGHSLGGALAVLATAALLDHAALGPSYRGTHTFGQPLVGDSTFCRALDAKVAGRWFRIANVDDPVPWTPPVFEGFAHGGIAKGLEDGGKLRDGAPLPQDKAELALSVGKLLGVSGVVSGALGWLTSAAGPAKPTDWREQLKKVLGQTAQGHRMSTYIKRLSLVHPPGA